MTYEAAWFLVHDNRKAMHSGHLASFGSGHAIVAVAEALVGRKLDLRKFRGGTIWLPRVRASAAVPITGRRNAAFIHTNC
jgi:hypothetical protein